ncbi:Na+/proline symporter [Pseudarcicella hirudinis]|uniref:Na+/proline symporter n=1 Tax=Pseudarcicella hirudinis TaxID=1079859 RepID=A0A1I5WEB8_9BACT|nr:sodium:solute symporter [Pseudarcicella hirudinis]SFQ17696.1 Na+/proline symporter [Pseudarcicella hirudinis]
MSTSLAISILVVYFLLLIIVAHFTSKGADTNTFFTANKQSPWWLVAFGMIGTSLSGVTFISVPGSVGKIHFSYFQVVLGYSLGYLTIALVLMPMYYRLNLISIYSYLEKRFGFWSYKTGSAFFVLSRTVGSAVRLYVAVNVLQLAIFDSLGVPFELTVLITIGLIWIYTFKGGVKTIIWTDTLQTFFLLTALIITIILISNQLHLGVGDMITQVSNSSYSKLFVWEWADKHHFVKDFLSGAFIAIVMTGLDQDLMQKNLTCKSIGEAQKNMFWFYIVLVFVNLLFLSLGALLYIYAQQTGFLIPDKTDDLYPMLALGGHFGSLAAVTFLLGIIAATYASSDSALTALTTSFCIDFMNIEKYEEAKRAKIKHYVHLGFSILFFLVIIVFKALNNQEVISAVFNLAGYTYGPLLGLFSFGLFLKTPVNDKFVPLVCILSPLFIYVLDVNSKEWFNGYQFGFEKLILNGLFTFAGLMILSKKQDKKELA